jgi:hypothetical protein
MSLESTASKQEIDSPGTNLTAPHPERADPASFERSQNVSSHSSLVRSDSRLGWDAGKGVLTR